MAVARGNSRGQLHVQFGEYGLKSLERGWLTNRQIEAARIAMTRKIKRGGKVWINVFPDKPITKKPAETRMGSGKGSPEGWVAVVKPGRVMFELAGVPSRSPAKRSAWPRTSFPSSPSSCCARTEDRDEGQARYATSTTPSWPSASPSCAKRCSVCASPTPPANSRHRRARARQARPRPGADRGRASATDRATGATD